ncbi:phage tail protein (plasmid) [Niveispirillum cyanobacteriorum]|uniref:Phage tail protein n=2 Tax=Niveispirillum cyanobacteriorum TaxID=1612173 RepID=A0A2K9NNQ2_9PROT|nr:phage tail protein [Niveispirillum cyanobacteriorum]
MFRSALFGASAAVAAAIGLATPAAACNSEPYIGTICTFAFDWCPRNYIQADGRTLAVREYQALFALIGFRYGGDNSSNFAIPDLRGRSAIGTGTGPGLQNIAIGAKVGQQQLTLQYTQVPLYPHTHTATFTGTGGGGSGPLAASGTLTLPVTGTTTGQTLSGNASLPVTADAKIGTSTPAGGTATLSNNVPLKTATGPAAQIYATGGANNVTVGPAGGVTGTASGPLNGVTVSNGTISGTATGNVSLPVTGATGITGGTVTVNQASAPATQPVSTQSPALGQTVCIAANGLYPDRP